MNFSLHCKIEYFKNNNYFPSILNLFSQLMRLFRNDFPGNVQHSIHTSDNTKRNSNVHFIFGNTVHAWPGLTVTEALLCGLNGAHLLLISYTVRFLVFISFGESLPTLLCKICFITINKTISYELRRRLSVLVEILAQILNCFLPKCQPCNSVWFCHVKWRLAREFLLQEIQQRKVFRTVYLCVVWLIC